MKGIIDGNFRRTLSIRLAEADTIIFLDISRYRCLYNVIKRQWSYWGKDRLDMPPGCPAKFDKNFFLFLRHIWQWRAQHHRSVMGYITIARSISTPRVYHLKSKKEIDLFLASLK